MAPQITLYTHSSGPNGWKVAYLLEALGLTYESKFLEFDKEEQKGDEHTSLNPNGRIPTIIDHTNNDYSLWESDAILLYLVDRFDKDGKFMPQDRYKALNLLFFQASGQGPYYGQLAHFKRYAPVQVPYAVERYGKEMCRILDVLEGMLSKGENGWLMDGKFTIVDLSFFPWHFFALGALLPEDKKPQDWPAVWSWHSRMQEMDFIQRVDKTRF